MNVRAVFLGAALALLLSASCWSQEPSVRDLYWAGSLQSTITPVPGPGPAQYAHQGCFRKEFTLPQGAVWRAVAEVARPLQVFVNGRLVSGEFVYQRPIWGGRLWQTVAVDLAPHLRPGRNVIALFGRQVFPQNTHNYDPFVYLHAKIVMASGQTVLVGTDATWRVGDTEVEGWTQPDFDDHAWARAKSSAPNVSYIDRLPGYDGRVVLENPDDTKLFYVDTAPVRVRLRLPEGLADRQPVVTWVLRRVNDAGAVEIVSGEQREFARQSPSLVATLDAGRQERGVYTLEVNLRLGAELAEARLPEPLVVVGKIPMPEVEGKTLEDGLALTLEDTIDFTDPNDPHLWVETDGLGRLDAPATAVTTPRVTRSFPPAPAGGDEQPPLVYRETTPNRSAMFSYQFRFQQPGAWYLMALEYPDDAERRMGVEVCTNKPKIWSNTQSGLSVYTGGKYPLSNRLQELRWIHLADAGVHTFDLVNEVRGQRAAASRVRIYRIAELPALKTNPSGERWLGLHSERAVQIGRNFGTADPEDEARFKAAGLVAGAAQRLRYYLDISENYTRYLRFTGQNLHVMGAFQYDEENTSYVPPERFATARIPSDVRDVALRVFAQNGISMLSMIEYAYPSQVKRALAPSDAEVAVGADTVWPVSREGKQAKAQANFLHPLIARQMREVVDDLAIKFSGIPAWKGVAVMTYPSFSSPSIYAPVKTPLDYDYSDVTIAAFERDTKIDVPGNAGDPNRFESRYRFLTQGNVRARWIDWRCQTVRRSFLGLRDAMREHRRDLQLVNLDYIDLAHVAAWCQSGRSYRDFFRDFGIDPTLYRQDENFWISRYIFVGRFWPTYPAADYVTAWEHAVGAEPIAAFERPDYRSVTLLNHWDEVDTRAPGVILDPKTQTWTFTTPSEWPVAGNRAHGLEAQPPSQYVREPYTQGLIGGDPEMLLYGFTDVNMTVGHEQALREFARLLTSLPKARFRPVRDTGFATNLAIRDLRQGGAYWCYVANPGYWPITGSITLSAAGTVVDPGTGEAVATTQDGGRMVIPVRLPPYGVAAFRVDSPMATVESWRTDPVSAADLAHLRNIIADVEQGLHTPVAAKLSAEDAAYARDTAGAAQAALAAGEYARAWSLVTHWRFWLLRQQLRAA